MNRNNKENSDWSSLNYEEKNKQLFLRQKKTLDMFLERGAISKARYDKSLYDLIKKIFLVDGIHGTPIFDESGKYGHFQ